MDEITATIWVKVGKKKKNAVVIGWKRIVKNWKKAGEENKCVIIGDLNLNYQVSQITPHQSDFI